MSALDDMTSVASIVRRRFVVVAVVNLRTEKTVYFRDSEQENI